MVRIHFQLNGAAIGLDDPDPTETVLDWLRIRMRLTGTKEGCNEGDCGACTVMLTMLANGGSVEHRAMNACVLFLPQLDGKAIRTVEGAGTPEAPHPVQARMIEHHGSQCGFCTPGFIMSMVAAHASGRTDHDDVLAGNLCRCTGYAPIIRAAEAAETDPRPAWLEADAVAVRTMARDRKPATTGMEAVAGPAHESATPAMVLPETADQLAEWYRDHPDWTLVGGATDLGLVVNKALKPISPVCFLSGVRDLQTLTAEDGGLRIGAAATMADLRDATADRHADLAELLRRFGSEQVRNAATIGGNIANGSPIGDAAPALIALDCTLTLRHGDDRREIALEDFFLAYGRQDIRPGEFIESLFLPAQPDRLRCYKLSRRFDQDITAVLGCFNITAEAGQVVSARIAFGGMAGTPMRARHTEALLLGESWTVGNVQRASAALVEDFTPISDLRASASYRMQAARNMLLRCFLEDTDSAPRILDQAP